MPSPKPLISVTDRSVAGSHLDAGVHDLTYVGGYSDVRQSIDRDLAAKREPTQGLQHRLEWVRTKRTNGQPDSRKVMEAQARGYTAVAFDDLGKLGLSPVAGVKTAEGHVGLGDVELFICTADQAARNEATVRRAVDSQSADESLSAELHRTGAEIDRSGGLTTSQTKRTSEVR